MKKISHNCLALSSFGFSGQIHLTRHFSHAHCTRLIMCILTAWLKTSQGSSVRMRASFHLHAIHGERLIVSSFCLSPCFSLSPTSSLPHSICTLNCIASVSFKTCSSTCHHVSCVSLTFVHSLRLLCPCHHVPCGRNHRLLKPTAHTQNEEFCSLAEFTLQRLLQ